MLSISKNNQSVFLLYVAKNFKSGATVIADIYDDSNVLFQSPSPSVTFTEIGTTGMYGASFTPTTNGEWKIKIFEDGTEKSGASIKIADYDIESVGGDVTSIKAILENVTYGNSALNDKLVDIQGATFNTSTDSLEAIKDYLVNTVQSSISSIQNNTRTTVAMPNPMLLPATGTTPYKIYLNIYDTDGNMEDPDDQDGGAGTAMVSVTVVNQTGTDRSANLSGLDASTQGGLDWLTRDAQGRFSFIYTVSDTDAIEQLNFSFDYLEAAVPRTVDRSVQVTDVADVSGIASDVTTILSEVQDGTYGLSALKTLIDGYLADGGTIETRFDTLDTNLATVDTVVDTTLSEIQNVTYGLSALKTLIDNIDVTTDVTNALDPVKTKTAGTYDRDTMSLEAISEQLGPGGYIA